MYQVRLMTKRMYSLIFLLKNFLTLCHLSHKKLVTVGCLELKEYEKKEEKPGRGQRAKENRSE